MLKEAKRVAFLLCAEKPAALAGRKDRKKVEKRMRLLSSQSAAHRQWLHESICPYLSKIK